MGLYAPDPSDPPSVRSEKRDRLIKLLEIKEVELASMKLSRGLKTGADGGIAEIAETPPVQSRLLGRLADPERRRRHLPELSVGLGGSSAKPGRRTHPRAQAIVNDDNTPIIRQRTGRDSLSRTFLLRRAGGLDTPMTAANTPGDTFATIYTNGTPGVYIPSMQERRIDVTGTELAEDMAGNLVAGIFAASDPCSVADSHGKVGAQESDEDELDPHATVLESQIENHTEERGDRPPSSSTGSRTAQMTRENSSAFLCGSQSIACTAGRPAAVSTWPSFWDRSLTRSRRRSLSSLWRKTSESL